MAKLNIFLALAAITLLLAISASAHLRGPNDDPRNPTFSLGKGPSPNDDDDKYAVSASFRLHGTDDDPRNTHFFMGKGPSPNDGEEMEVEAPSPNDDDESALAPEPYPGFFAFIDKCMKKMSEKCGIQISSAIFDEGDVSNRCCGELVNMGKHCHSEMIKATTILPFITDEMKEKFEKKDTEVLYKCVSSIAS